MVIKVKYNGEWVKIPYLSSDHGQELVEEAPKDGSQYARQNGVWSVVNIPEVDFTEVYNAIDTKVDKVEGKSLSTNDYVTADKTKVTNINEVIEAATKNITATDISITLDKRNLVTNAVENIELNLPASTTALAGLMLPSDKTKLNGIAAGAEVNVNADWNATEGDALILNKPTLATVATSGSYDDLNDKPDLSLISINKISDAAYFQNILSSMIAFSDYTLTQEGYNAILSACPENEKVYTYSLVGQLVTNGAGDIVLVQTDGDIMAMIRTNSALPNIGGSLITYTVNISTDLSFALGVEGSEIGQDQSDSSSLRINVYKQNPNKQTNTEIKLNTGGDGTKALMDDGTYKPINTHDYTVFDIVSEILQMDVPSISQENYNYLVSVIQGEEGIPNDFAIRPLSLGICSLIGTKNSGVITLTLDLFKDTNILLSSYVITIGSDLSINIKMKGVSYSVDNSTLSFSAIATEGESMTQNSITFQTKGDKSESLMADGKYRKLPVYGRNLLLGSGKEVSNSNYEMANYWLAEQIPNGSQVTVTIWGELGKDCTGFILYNSGSDLTIDGKTSSNTNATITLVDGEGHTTVNWDTRNEVNNTFLRIHTLPIGGSNNSVSTIHKIKLEYGDLSTEWTPAWEDIPDLEERYAYGVEWDTASSSPDGVRVGNMQLHRELPIQSKMRICEVTNEGGVIAASTTGMVNNENGNIMTEIPEHWYKLYTNGTKFKMMLSEIPLPGYKHVDTFYISTYEACIDRNINRLWSENLYRYNNVDTLTRFRGGDNTSDWDGTYRSLLMMPVTNLTRDQFRQAARKRGSGWEMYTYNAHKILFWLFAVEYATLNSQKPFNAQKDANGFAQGGLGPGPTQMTDWANFNNTNPLIPCGYTNEFGNGSGEKAYVVKNASGGTHATLMANRYRGIENPFGHIWKYTDGANIQVTTGDAGLSILWTTDDPSNFSDTSYTGYDKKGNICRTNGYAKKMLLGEDGDIVATEIGGSSSTYWCDYYITYTSANRMQVVLVGGNAGDGSYAGLARVYADNAPSVASRNVGSRLCFFPQFRKTSA